MGYALYMGTVIPLIKELFLYFYLPIVKHVNIPPLILDFSIRNK